MISLILIFLAAIFNACMDTVTYRWYTCIFKKCKNEQWFNPSISWMNKWKLPSSIEEKFFGSSTFLVFLTDFWHLCKFLMILLISGAIVFYTPLVNWWVDILIMYSTFTITFELFFSKIFIKHKNI